MHPYLCLPDLRRNVIPTVAEVFSTWHLMDRWWERPVNPATATYSLRTGEQDRTYYHVRRRGPAGEPGFDLYHDSVTNLWVLDVAHDGRDITPMCHVRRTATAGGRRRPCPQTEAKEREQEQNR